MRTLGLWLYLEGEERKGSVQGDSQVSWVATGWQVGLWCVRSRRGQGSGEKFLHMGNHLHYAFCKSLCWRKGASKAKTTNTFIALKSGAKKRYGNDWSNLKCAYMAPAVITAKGSVIKATGKFSITVCCVTECPRTGTRKRQPTNLYSAHHHVSSPTSG